MTSHRAGSGGLLIDSNLLVLLIVGSVNPNRISTFKRTSKYHRTDFELLAKFAAEFQFLYSVPHVFAEVSNLTDLKGQDRERARAVLSQFIQTSEEHLIPSATAAGSPYYQWLGLVDAAILQAASVTRCHVITDDSDLYSALSRGGIMVTYFGHLQARH